VLVCSSCKVFIPILFSVCIFSAMLNIYLPIYALVLQVMFRLKLYIHLSSLNCGPHILLTAYHPKISKKKQSLYTPWRRLGGEEV
jgi:hypothetical protein